LETAVTNDNDTPVQPETDPGTPPRPPVPRPPKPKAAVATPPPMAAPPTPADVGGNVENRREERLPWLAATLSIVPCLGHLYVGAVRRAAGLFVAWVLAIVILPLGLNVAACIFLWFFGLFDAYRQAQLVNAGGQPMSDSPPPSGVGGLAFGVFLTAAGALLLFDRIYGLDFEWVRRWWPAFLIIVGLYFIGDWLWDRLRPRPSSPDDDFEV
jgi:hypothetical protein